MAKEEDTGKTEAELVDRVWELADKIKFALFTTWNGAEQAQWPLSASVEREADAIYFLVGHKGGKYEHLDEFPAVTLGFVDTGGGKYYEVERCSRQAVWCIVSENGHNLGWVEGSYLIGSGAKDAVTPFEFLVDPFDDDD